MTTATSRRIYFLIILCTLSKIVNAQIDMSKIELGVNATAFIYQGDLTPTKIGSLKTIKPGLGLFGIYKLNTFFSLKTNFDFGRLKGDESKYASPAYRQERNFKFTTPVTEISGSIIWNILPSTSEGGTRLTPYISAGIGYTFLHIRRNYNNFNAAYFSEESGITNGLAADTAHSLPRGQLVFPISMGVRYALTDHISLNFESQYRFNSTDYLDGFSQSVNPAKKRSLLYFRRWPAL